MGNSDGKVIIQVETNAAKAAQDFKQLDNAIKDLNRDTQQTKTQTNNVSSGFSGASSALFSLKGAALAAAGAFAAMKLTQFAGDIFKISSQFEQLNVAFEVLAGQSAGAQLVKDLTDLANVTPMTTQGLADNAKLLLSFGEASQNVISDLKLLGDISGGNQQKMDSLALAFAQAGSAGRLTGQDLLQMVNAGFNPLQQISEKTGKSMGELRKEMEKGNISFSMIKQSMIEATSEGGRFFGMMDKQSQTLEGRLSTMADKWGLVGKKIGDEFLPMIKSATNGLINVAEKMISADSEGNKFNQHLSEISSGLSEVARGLMKAVGGLGDFKNAVGAAIPGTGLLDDALTGLNNKFKSLGLAIQIAAAPLILFREKATFKDVSDEVDKIMAKFKGMEAAELKIPTLRELPKSTKKAATEVEKLNIGFRNSSIAAENHTKKVKEADSAYGLFQKKIAKTTEELQVMALKGQAGTAVFEAKKRTLDGYKTTLENINKAIETQVVTNPYDKLQKDLEKATQQMRDLAAQGKVDLPAFKSAKDNATALSQQLEKINKTLVLTPTSPYDQLSQNIAKMKSELENLAVGGQAGTPAFDKLKNDYIEATQAMEKANSQIASSTGETWSNIGKGIKQDFVSAFTTSLQSGETAFERLQNFAFNVIGNIANKLLTDLINNTSLSALTSGASGISGGIGSFFGNLFKSANGNVFQGGKILPHANGGVVDKFSAFPMANGNIGTMSEGNKPEAIMPLKRGANGKLGVEATNSSPNINIYNQSQSQIEKVKRPNGEMDIFIRKVNTAITSDKGKSSFAQANAMQQSRGVTAA